MLINTAIHGRDRDQKFSKGFSPDPNVTTKIESLNNYFSNNY